MEFPNKMNTDKLIVQLGKKWGTDVNIVSKSLKEIYGLVLDELQIEHNKCKNSSIPVMRSKLIKELWYDFVEYFYVKKMNTELPNEMKNVKDLIKEFLNKKNECVQEFITGMDDEMKKQLTINKQSENSLSVGKPKHKQCDDDQSTTEKQIINKFICIICFEETSTNIAKLDCDHSYCISCFAQHIRQSGSCPLCRKDIVSKPKKIEKMPSQVMTQIIENQANLLYPERNVMSLENYIKYYLKYYQNEDKSNLQLNRMSQSERNMYLLKTIMAEIKNYGEDVCYATCKWYED